MKHMTSLALTAALVLSGLLAIGGPASASTVAAQAVTTDQGSTTEFGGGDYFRIHARDLDFAVLYGSAAQPNGITIATSFTRYLGGAEVYDEDGNLVHTMGIPVRTLIAQKLSFFVEYRDIALDPSEVQPVGNHTTDGLNATGYEHESQLDGQEALKAVSLNTSWTISPITDIIDPVNKTRTFTFSLTATDLPYVFINEVPDESIVLDRVVFTFHLYATVEPVEIANVPWYAVTVTTERPRHVVDSEFIEYRNYTGVAINASGKYDQLIEGWDFSASDSKLALVNGILVGTWVPPLTAQWIHEEFLAEENAGGDATFEAHQEEHEVNGTAPLRPVLLTRTHISLADNWQRIGRLTWVSDLTVTYKNQTSVELREGVVYQAAFVRTFDHLGARGGLFRGFLLIGAYIYPGGQEVASLYHDPALQATALDFNPLPRLPPLPRAALLLQIGLGLVAAAGAGGYLLYKRTRPPVQPIQPVLPGITPQPRAPQGPPSPPTPPR